MAIQRVITGDNGACYMQVTIGDISGKVTNVTVVNNSARLVTARFQGNGNTILSGASVATSSTKSTSLQSSKQWVWSDESIPMLAELTWP